jgi:hypothetical protein
MPQGIITRLPVLNEDKYTTPTHVLTPLAALADVAQTVTPVNQCVGCTYEIDDQGRILIAATGVPIDSLLPAQTKEFARV